MPRGRGGGIALVLLACVASALPVTALEVRGTDLRTTASTVEAVFELRDFLANNSRKLLDQGAKVHLHVQAQVWERRAVWDLLLYPAAVRVVQVTKTAGGTGIVLVDADGTVSTHDPIPAALALSVLVGSPDRLKANARYYVQVLATVGTIAEREVDTYGDAVFGRSGEANGLGALGRMVLRGMLHLSDYLQSASAEGKSRLVPGGQLLQR